MIEVGEYVRTKSGKLDKVINNNCYMPQYIECEKSIVYKEDIVKHSKNIIDLIELYDYVNGMIVFDIITYDNEEKAIKISSKYLMSENEIQDILTHEQYQVNCYTVERNEEC